MASSCSLSTERGARPMRCRRFGRAANDSTMSWASSRVGRCRSSNARFWYTMSRSTRLRRPEATAARSQSARSRASRPSASETPDSSAGGSNSSTTSSPAWPRARSSASSDRRGSASRLCFALASCVRSPRACCPEASTGRSWWCVRALTQAAELEAARSGLAGLPGRSLCRRGRSVRGVVHRLRR